MVDYVSGEVRLEEGTPSIIPVTAWEKNKQKHMQHNRQADTYVLFDIYTVKKCVCFKKANI